MTPQSAYGEAERACPLTYAVHYGRLSGMEMSASG